MPTNDGYSPYPLNLTALQVKTAIDRAHNLSTELLGYVAYRDSTVPPTLAQGIKEGDIWHNPSLDPALGGGKYYRAYLDGSALVYFEV